MNHPVSSSSSISLIVRLETLETIESHPFADSMDATIKSSFWSDSRIEELPADQKLALLWLLTNPSRDLCGFTRVSARRFQFETGLAITVLGEACKALPSSFHPPSEGVYFAVHFLRHQFGKGGALNLRNKVIVAAARHADALPIPLRSSFFEAYPELLSLIEKSSSSFHANTSPIDPPSENPEGVRVREGARAGEENLSEEGCGEEPTADIPGIVALYPRREGVAEAIGHVTRHLRAGADVRSIIEGTKAIAAVISQMPSGHLNAFVPAAAAFFAKRRWEDDPATWLRNGNSRTNGAAPPPPSLGGRKPGSHIKISQP